MGSRLQILIGKIIFFVSFGLRVSVFNYLLILKIFFNPVFLRKAEKQVK